MKKLFLLAICLNGVLAYAQEFAPIGARWIYTTGGSGYPVNIQLYQYTSIKDTVVLDKLSRKIERIYYTKVYSKETIDSLSPYIVHQDADTVYLFNPDKQTFDRLYVFNVSKGDTITLDVPFDVVYNPENTSEFRLVIDSVAIENISSYQLKKYRVNPVDDFVWANLWYMDRIGGLDWFTPRYINLIPEDVGPLICYKDSEVSIPNGSSSCDLVTGLVPERQPLQTTIYPNPARNIIKINARLAIDKVEVYTTNGTLLATSFSDQVNTGNLNTGQYLLKIYSGGQTIVKSVIIE